MALALAASALALIALAPGSTAATETNVSIVYRAYQPADLTILAGQSVIWTNSGLGPHTVTSDAGQFDSGKLEAGAAFSYTFSAPGTYLYSCTVHPTMHGKVVVLAELPQVVRVHLSKQRGPHGAVTLVRVQTPRPRATALVQLRHGSRWSTVRRVQLDGSGAATLKLGASVRGPLRVVVRGPGAQSPLVSKTLRR